MKRELKEIIVDCGEYIGILYEDEQSREGIPVGMIGPSEQASDIAKAAGQWLAEGTEYFAKRKVVVAYRPDDIEQPMEIDFVMTSDVKGETSKYRLVKIEDPS